MAHYAIAFDIDTKRMANDGISDSERTQIYQVETKDALKLAGFPDWIQGSVYCTESDQNGLRLLTNLQQVLREKAPRFCRYVRKIHVFRMEDVSEITDLISTYTEPE